MNADEILGEIADTIQDRKNIMSRVAVDEKKYNRLKNKYELELLELKYSEEYEQYKTIKEKEERARIELYSKKNELLNYEQDIKTGKHSLEICELTLRYLFACLYIAREDNGCCDDNEQVTPQE